MIGHGMFDVVVGTTITKDSRGNWPIALRVGTGGGDMVVTSPKGNNHTFKNVSNGEWIPVTVTKVVSVTATVADIIAIYE